MKYISKSTYIKIIAFGLFKKLVLIYFLFFATAHASGTYGGIYFDDYEEKASIYLINYYPYQHFRDIYLGSTDSKDIIKKRPFVDLSDLENTVSLNDRQWNYIRQDSHLIDWNKYTDEFGMTLHQTNFIYALVGTLIGFTFLFFFIYIIIGAF